MATDGLIFTAPLITSNGFTTNNVPLVVTLKSAPAPGTLIQLINNTSNSPINGSFAGLSPNGTYNAVFNSINHALKINYAGDTGNDLTLAKIASTTTTLTTSASTTTYGQAVTFSARVASGDQSVTVGTVAFVTGGVTLASVPVSSTGTATFTTSNLAAASSN